MRIIPKKIKVKNTVFKCYSMIDVVVALVMFAVIFALLTKGYIVVSISMLLLTMVLFIPTQDGIFYEYLIENVKFLVENKSYYKTNTKAKKDIANLINIESIDDRGTVSYKSNTFSKVIKLGQKNFGIEDEYQQDLDIEYFANVLKLLDESIEMDLVKIDKRMNLDDYATERFNKSQELENTEINNEDKKLKQEILREQIDEIDKLNNLQKKYLAEFYIVLYGKSIDEVEKLAYSVVSEINKCGIAAKILDKKETALFLKYNFKKDFDERELNKIEDENLIDWIVPDKIIFKQNKYYIDDLEASTFSISEYPLRVKNAWGANIFNIPNTKVVMHIKPVEKIKAIRRIDKSISEMQTKQLLSEKASDTNSAEIHRETMQGLLDSLQAENESLLDVNITLTAYNYDKDEDYKKEVKRKLIVNGFKPSNLYGKQIEGFKISAPISKKNELKNYVRGINSSSLAAVFPFVRTFVMDRGGVLLGQNKINNFPFIFNIWKRGQLYQNSNAMVIGQSGSGKSYFLKNLIINEWADGVRVIILDPENEYSEMVEKLNGEVINVASNEKGSINPFHIYKTLSEDGDVADPCVTFNTHLKMLESFFKIVLVGASSDVMELINNLVIKAYKMKNITENTLLDNASAESFPIFSDLLKVLEDEEKTASAEKGQIYESAKLYLDKFVNGRYSDIWNHPSTLLLEKDVVDFNFQTLFANKNNIVANAQMLLIFRFIEQEVINNRTALRRKKTMIITDEAHLFIDSKYPIALDFFYQMNKRIRKYHGSFIPATQNINDWNASEELKNKTSTIIKNSQYLFIFKLTPPDMADVIELYKTGDGFNEDEQRSIITATTGEAFFVGSSESRGMVKIKANDYVKGIFDGGIEYE